MNRARVDAPAGASRSQHAARRVVWAVAGGIFLVGVLVVTQVVRVATPAARNDGIGIVLFALSLLLVGIGTQMGEMRRAWRVTLGVATVTIVVWLLLVAFVFARP